MRKHTEEERLLLEGYRGDHGSLSDGKGNILKSWDTRELEKHKVLMRDQLWAAYERKYNEEIPITKQLNLFHGVLPENEAAEIRNKMKKFQDDYERKKSAIMSSKTCDECHHIVHGEA
jgi:hypothetical protein